MLISAYLGTSGLTDVGYRFYTSAEAASGARVTTGITEGASGWYSADATIPSNGASVRWDSTGTSTAKASEYFDPRMKQIKAAVYDTASVSGTVVTLSDGATQTVTAAGRTTA